MTALGRRPPPLRHRWLIYSRKCRPQHKGCYIGCGGMELLRAQPFYLPFPQSPSLQNLPHIILSIVSFHLPSKNPGKYIMLLPVIFETLPKLTHCDRHEWDIWHHMKGNGYELKHLTFSSTCPELL